MCTHSSLSELSEMYISIIRVDYKIGSIEINSQYWKNFQLNTSRKLNLFSTKHVMIDAEDFLEMIPKNGEIRVYLWNNSNDEILIENFIVQFKNKENSK